LSPCFFALRLGKLAHVFRLAVAQTVCGSAFFFFLAVGARKRGTQNYKLSQSSKKL